MLIDYAREHDPEHAAAKAQRIRAAVRAGRTPTVESADFLAEARRMLPPEVFELVAKKYDSGSKSAVVTRRGGGLPFSVSHVR